MVKVGVILYSAHNAVAYRAVVSPQLAATSPHSARAAAAGDATDQIRCLGRHLLTSHCVNETPPTAAAAAAATLVNLCTRPHH